MYGQCQFNRVIQSRAARRKQHHHLLRGSNLHVPLYLLLTPRRNCDLVRFHLALQPFAAHLYLHSQILIRVIVNDRAESHLVADDEKARGNRAHE